jgi:hypothetical protein
VTEYGYSDAGFSVGGQLYHNRITDGENKSTHIALDAFGNRTKTLYPSGDFEEYRYSIVTSTASTTRSTGSIPMGNFPLETLRLGQG